MVRKSAQQLAIAAPDIQDCSRGIDMTADEPLKGIDPSVVRDKWHLIR
jgi:hypothetical protein